MRSKNTIYVLGAGAIGFPLAAYLAHEGRSVVAVRTSTSDIPQSSTTITVEQGATQIHVPLETVSFARLGRLDGMIVVASKAYANQALARELNARAATGPIVILQNGVGVEQPFLEAGLSSIYRCVLYITSQSTAPGTFAVRPVTASPIGIVTGTDAELQQCVDVLNTEGFPFRVEGNIQRDVWKKAIINAVFNSICPLLHVDNGIFKRDPTVAALAHEIIRECVALTDRLDLGLSERELMDQLFLISTRSDGQFISTLQDLQRGRPTEIAFLNLKIARVAASLQPPLQLPRTELLGNMIVAKSGMSQQTAP